MPYYKCVELSKRYTGRMFKLDGVYRSPETETQPAVIDELGHVRVLGSNLRFVVGHWGGPIDVCRWRQGLQPIRAAARVVPVSP